MRLATLPGMSKMTPETARAVAHGWSAVDVSPDELVDDAWIAANTVPGRAPSRARHVGSRLLAAARSPRTLKSGGGLTRDQMRRIAARTGYPYVEAWSSRNNGAMSGVWGALIHHTGTPWSAAGDYPTLKIVQQGRSDLQNSLCAFGLGRSGTIYLVSEKLSWHAGGGNVNGCTDGNGKLVGIEAESDGVNWTPEERDAYPRLVAAILVEIGQDDRYTTRHATYALPAGRKTDATGLDMDLFWRQVYAYLANPASIDRNYRAGFPIVGAIRGCYDRPGVAAALGAPLGPEVPTSNPAGRWQQFERGRVLWHPTADAARAHELHGEIEKRFIAAGYETKCGWPITDEGTCPDTAGRFTHFTGGLSIYHHPQAGTWRVFGQIRNTWAAQGWEAGALGYPVDEEHPAEGGIVQNFTGGSVLWANGTGTVRGL